MLTILLPHIVLLEYYMGLCKYSILDSTIVCYKITIFGTMDNQEYWPRVTCNITLSNGHSIIEDDDETTRKEIELWRKLD